MTRRPSISPTPRAYPANPITRRQVVVCSLLLIAAIVVFNLPAIGWWW